MNQAPETGPTGRSGRRPSSRRRSPAQGPITILAIGKQGWAVAERQVERPTALIIGAIAEQLRGIVRADTGWMPSIVVLDGAGADVTDEYPVD